MSSLPDSTRAWILANHPTTLPTYSQTDSKSTFQLVTQPIPALKPNQVLVQTLFLSNDPSQRGWINGNIPGRKAYVPPVQLKEVMRARGLAKVLKSTSSAVPEGSLVQCVPGWAEYAVLNADEVTVREPLPLGLSSTHYLGVFGTTGVTAYYGLVVVGEAKKGMKIVVSGAAGATGIMVVQVAKHIVGCSEIIAIAGSDEKCRYVEEHGADVCLNYRSKTFAQDLEKATGGEADLYFDNVGGEILDMMLMLLKRHGVIVACGAISSYNSGGGMASLNLKNYGQIISQRFSLRGFVVHDYMDKQQEVVDIFLKSVREGKMKIDDKSEQIVPTKVEELPKTWLRLFDGGNTGKLITKVE